MLKTLIPRKSELVRSTSVTSALQPPHLYSKEDLKRKYDNINRSMPENAEDCTKLPFLPIRLKVV